MTAKHIHTKDLKTLAKTLHSGDMALLSGFVYTARDAAHKEIFKLLDKGLPFPIEGSVIYYAGPTEAPPGKPVGSCGPTTAGRMDPYTPRLLDMGLAGMIGKGERSEAVTESLKKNGAVYFNAVGGAGALISRHITGCEVIAFPELGCESVKRMEIFELPLIVALDTEGESLFKSGRRAFACETKLLSL